MQTKRIRCETLHFHGNFFRSSITQIGTWFPTSHQVTFQHSLGFSFFPKVGPLKTNPHQPAFIKRTPPRCIVKNVSPKLQTVLHSCEFPRQHCLDGAPPGKIHQQNPCGFMGYVRKLFHIPSRFFWLLFQMDRFLWENCKEKRNPSWKLCHIP